MVSRNPLAQVAWKLGCHSYHCIIVLTGHFFFKDTPLKNTVRSRIGFQMCYWHRRPHCRPCQENREFRIWTDEFAGNRPFVIFSHKLGTFFNIWFIICCSQLGHVHPIHFFPARNGWSDGSAPWWSQARILEGCSDMWPYISHHYQISNTYTYLYSTWDKPIQSSKVETHWTNKGFRVLTDILRVPCRPVFAAKPM